MPPPLLDAELPERVELVSVRLLLLKMPPPCLAAEFPDMVELETVRVRLLLLKMPPPLPPPPLPKLVVAELPERVELEMVMVPSWLKMPPPYFALLPERVELETVRLPVLEIPPPYVALLPERVELVRVMAPLLLNIAPPEFAELPERVEFETLRMPELLKAPPLPDVFAPETVTPEIERLPPEAMLKILKSRLLLPPSKPLMIREEEPGPVIVRVPAVPPPVIGVLALIMVGSEALTVLLRELRVIVPVMLKLMMSSPAVVLASIIACRRVPAPESALEETIMGVFEGVILSSR